MQSIGTRFRFQGQVLIAFVCHRLRPIKPLQKQAYLVKTVANLPAKPQLLQSIDNENQICYTNVFIFKNF